MKDGESERGGGGREREEEEEEKGGGCPKENGFNEFDVFKRYMLLEGDLKMIMKYPPPTHTHTFFSFKYK